MDFVIIIGLRAAMLRNEQVTCEGAMAVLSYRCPNTSDEVVTAIDTDGPRLAKMRDLKVSVVCPHCPAGHSIPANAMYFGAQPLPQLMRS
jgi:hypothetical protein